MPARVHRGSGGPDQRLTNWLYSRACLPCRDGGDRHGSCRNCMRIARWMLGARVLSDSELLELRAWARSRAVEARVGKGHWREVAERMERVGVRKPEVIEIKLHELRMDNIHYWADLQRRFW